jgi:hypothetical protein
MALAQPTPTGEVLSLMIDVLLAKDRLAGSFLSAGITMHAVCLLCACCVLAVILCL